MQKNENGKLVISDLECCGWWAYLNSARYFNDMVEFQSISVFISKTMDVNLLCCFWRERRKCKSGHVVPLKMSPEVGEWFYDWK